MQYIYYVYSTLSERFFRRWPRDCICFIHFFSCQRQVSNSNEEVNVWKMKHFVIWFDSIRGRLGSMTNFLRNTGILANYILGAVVEYNYIPWINIVVPVIFAIVFIILPNTPQYYLQKGKTQVSFILTINVWFFYFKSACTVLNEIKIINKKKDSGKRIEVLQRM